MEFKEVTLGQISIDNKGSYGIAASAVDYSKLLPTYLRITDISDEGYIIKNSLKSVDEINSEKYKLEINDIVFARTGNSTGKSYFYDGEDGEFIYAGFLIKFSLDPKKVNPKYIRFYTLSEDYKNWIKSFSTGSTRGNINAHSYANMKIRLPEREYQDFVVNTLSKLENKIKTNNKMIKILEQLSHTIFKQWFINFEFPNKDGQPYKSSGGELSKSILGEIPSSWQVGKLGDISFQKTERINLDFSKEQFNYIGLEHMPQRNIALVNWEDSSKVSGTKSLFKENDILFGKLRPYFKKVGISPINGVCSTDIIVINSKESYLKSYLFLNLIQDSLIKYTSNTATGTRMPRTSWNLLSDYKIILPDKDILEKFEGIVSPFLQKINFLIHEINNLKQLRDYILPKLLSGEITIPEELDV